MIISLRIVAIGLAGQVSMCSDLGVGWPVTRVPVRVHGCGSCAQLSLCVFRRSSATHRDYIRCMRIHLDAEKCQGHNRCYALAPELFDVDEYGQSLLLVDGDVPESLHASARLAAANCPEYAIKIVED